MDGAERDKDKVGNKDDMPGELEPTSSRTNARTEDGR